MLQKSFITLSTFSTPVIISSLSTSSIPNNIIPPFVLAIAEYVSHNDLGTSFLDFLHSKSSLSPNLRISSNCNVFITSPPDT